MIYDGLAQALAGRVVGAGRRRRQFARRHGRCRPRARPAARQCPVHPARPGARPLLGGPLGRAGRAWRGDRRHGRRPAARTRADPEDARSAAGGARHRLGLALPGGRRGEGPVRPPPPSFGLGQQADEPLPRHGAQRSPDRLLRHLAPAVPRLHPADASRRLQGLLRPRLSQPQGHGPRAALRLPAPPARPVEAASSTCCGCWSATSPRSFRAACCRRA